MSRYADDERWRRARRRKLRDTPGCERCPRPATQVHHRDERGLDGPHRYEQTNLESLCQTCHSRQTAQRPGGWRTAPRRREPDRHPGLLDPTEAA